MKSVVALAAALNAAIAFGFQREQVDPRTRTYVYPERIAWASDGLKAEELLLPRHGQVPEAGWGQLHPPSGCRLANDVRHQAVVVDFGREIHGGVQLAFAAGSAGQKVRVRFGESLSEALSDIGKQGASNDHAIRDDVVTAPAMGTRELGNTGFRFVYIDIQTEGSVTLEFVRAVSLMRPMRRLGGFRSSDDRLNRIFETAVRTVHLCCQDYLWDGIKRDRLVWMGDMHPETMGVLRVFGAQDILPSSLDLMAAVTSPDEWMNTMGPYTLWWLRNIAEWYRFTGDRAYLARHGDYIRRTFENLSNHMTASNTLEGIRRPFLDWQTEHNREAVHAGVQALALVTCREGEFLAKELGDEGLGETCRSMASRLETLKGRLSPNNSKQAAAMLALSGMEDPKTMYEDVLGENGHSGVSTFYGYYMLEAMSMAGEDRRALDTVRDYWGAMLDVGATSFWEDFDIGWTNNCFRIDQLPVDGKKDIHGDYGEFCYTGFRRSLCHGWSCGPAAWLIEHVLGIRPVDVGCKTVMVRPFLGDLEWAEGAMALPDGQRVRVRVEKSVAGEMKVKVDAPDGVRIVR